LKVVARKQQNWHLWENPVHVWQVFDVDQVESVLQQAQDWATASGGELAGYLSYEAAPAFEKAMLVCSEKTGQNPSNTAVSMPLLCLGGYHTSQRLDAFLVPDLEPDAENSLAGDYAEMMLNLIQENVSCDHYFQGIQEIRQAEAQGRCYQVNFTWHLKGSVVHTGKEDVHDNQNGSPQQGQQDQQDQAIRYIAQNILNSTVAPYAAWIEFDRYRIASASPELFFQVQKGKITLRPMKGTAPRSNDAAQDTRNRKDLESSEKERAENLMITDMIRNDVGRIAQPGSVQALHLFSIEKYPTVWQMTSTVQAELSTLSLSAILRALFPCASITGAPKIEAMKMIASAENSPRGVYTGAIGYWNAQNGDCQFSVAIRTLEAHLTVANINANAVYLKYGTGSGVVWDSRPMQEWRECWHKTRVLHVPKLQTKISGSPFEVLETMLAVPAGFIASGLPGFADQSQIMHRDAWLELPGCRVFLGPKHLLRMQSSAKELGYAFELEQVLEQLQEQASKSTDIFANHQFVKIRFLLDAGGTCRVEFHPLESALFDMGNRHNNLNCALAVSPCNSKDWRLRHKTTARTPYKQNWERALDLWSPLKGNLDEVLLYNEKSEITETRYGNVIYKLSLCEDKVSETQWYTPPLASGLLNGTLRCFMLDQAMIHQRTLMLEELIGEGSNRKVHEIRRINSVSGVQRLNLVRVPSQSASCRTRDEV
jgi:para-aminobenzoate synthetase/4-amino-4-deoxychorismate lyase